MGQRDPETLIMVYVGVEIWGSSSSVIVPPSAALLITQVLSHLKVSQGH